jgi:chorismate mutase
MKLVVLRRRIDRLDLRLLDLLNQRALLALRVGALKRRRQQPIFDPKREQRVLHRMAQKSRGPLSKAAVRDIFRAILRYSRTLQRSRIT